MTAALAAYVEQLRRWLDLPDPSHVLLVIAAAATHAAEGEPLWLLLVAPPSSGKTEAVGLIGGVADARLDDITPAGLLGWTRGRESRPSGVLTRVGRNALVTIGDLSTLLASSDRGSRDEVFALLRRAYDGEVTRDISPPGKAAPGARLHWTGRLTAVGAVTAAIDRYAAHADELGARWVYYRLPERDTLARRRAARAARGGNLDQHRRAARDAAQILIADAAGRVDRVAVGGKCADRIEDAALVTCWGRASVPRHGYGKREIDGVATIEEPPRVTRQLHMLARGLLALGLDEDRVTTLVQRVALDSMPVARRAVLTALAQSPDEMLPTAVLAHLSGLHWNVAFRHAEDLEQIGIVSAVYSGQSDQDGTGAKIIGWRWSGPDGKFVARVISQVSTAVHLTQSVGSIEMEEMKEEGGGGTGPTLRVRSEAPDSSGCSHHRGSPCLPCRVAAQRAAADDAFAALLAQDEPPDDGPEPEAG